MKKVVLNVALFAALSGGLFACSGDQELKNRVADLEQRIDRLEASGKTLSSPEIKQASAKPNQVEEAKGPFAAFKFEETEHDFGDIKDGDVVTHTFKFTNTGEAPLIIKSANASCGCTVPSKPDEPIAVGETGEIKVQFNSKNKPGTQRKTVRITANTKPATTYLKIKAQVAKKPELSASGPVKQ